MTAEMEQTFRAHAQRVRITKRIVDNMRPGETIWDKDLAGFGVRLQRRDPSFVLKYTFRGRQRFYTIGRHVGGSWAWLRAASILLKRPPPTQPNSIRSL